VIWVHRIAAVIIGLSVAVIFFVLMIAAWFYELGDVAGWLFISVVPMPAAGLSLVFGYLSAFFYYHYFGRRSPQSPHTTETVLSSGDEFAD
jgi:hypothetical protein